MTLQIWDKKYGDCELWYDWCWTPSTGTVVSFTGKVKAEHGIPSFSELLVRYIDGGSIHDPQAAIRCMTKGLRNLTAQAKHRVDNGAV